MGKEKDEIDEFTEIEKFNVLVSKDNLLKKVKDYSESTQVKDSNIKTSIPILSNHKLLIFLSSGKVTSTTAGFAHEYRVSKGLSPGIPGTHRSETNGLINGFESRDSRDSPI